MVYTRGIYVFYKQINTNMLKKSQIFHKLICFRDKYFVSSLY